MKPTFTQKFGGGMRKFLEDLEAEQRKARRRRLFWTAVAVIIGVGMFIVLTLPFWS